MTSSKCYSEEIEYFNIEKDINALSSRVAEFNKIGKEIRENIKNNGGISKGNLIYYIDKLNDMASYYGVEKKETKKNILSKYKYKEIYVKESIDKFIFDFDESEEYSIKNLFEILDKLYLMEKLIEEAFNPIKDMENLITEFLQKNIKENSNKNQQNLLSSLTRLSLTFNFFNKIRRNSEYEAIDDFTFNNLKKIDIFKKNFKPNAVKGISRNDTIDLFISVFGYENIHIYTMTEMNYILFLLKRIMLNPEKIMDLPMNSNYLTRFEILNESIENEFILIREKIEKIPSEKLDYLTIDNRKIGNFAKTSDFLKNYYMDMITKKESIRVRSPFSSTYDYLSGSYHEGIKTEKLNNFLFSILSNCINVSNGISCNYTDSSGDINFLIDTRYSSPVKVNYR